MTPAQQQKAIAEACGWKCNGHPDQIAATGGWEFGHQFVIAPDSKLVTHNSIPDYLGDLNAINEAEKTLSKEQQYENLRKLAPDWRSWKDGTAYLIICYATASERAKAFLLTLNLWTED